MSLKVGSCIYNVIQGLGVLAKDFYDHGLITHPIIAARPSLERKRPEQKDWYPPDTPKYLINKIDANSVVDYWRRNGVQLALFLETPFDWSLINRCRHVGIRTVLMPMHECTPARLPDEPDAWFCPSHLDLFAFSGIRDAEPGEKVYPKDPNRRRCFYLPVPVDIDKVPWKKRERCKVFVHNAGHGGLRGRNGTSEIVAALEYVESTNAIFHFRSQEIDAMMERKLAAVSSQLEVEYFSGTMNYLKLYEEGDCFLFPEKFNGLSLPLQEARASGMLVMCGDRFPMNKWLPTEPLIRVDGYRKNRIGPPYMEFDEALIEPRDIAFKIDQWFDKDISEYSLSGAEWANANSWAALKPKYEAAMESLL